MMIFLYAKDNPTPKHADRRRFLLSEFQKKGVQFVTNIAGHGGSTLPYGSGGVALDEEDFFYGADGVCVEYDDPDFNLHIIARACVERSVPLVVLVHDSVSSEEQIPEYAKILRYTKDNCSDKIEEILNICAAPPTSLQSVKFTVRITPQIERFLDREAKKQSVSKADFVRKLIEDKMEK